MLLLGSHSKGRKSTRDKANLGNPEVSRGCPPLTANRTSAECGENPLGPSVQYIPLGVYLIGGFNAMRSQLLCSFKYLAKLVFIFNWVQNPCCNPFISFVFMCLKFYELNRWMFSSSFINYETSWIKVTAQSRSHGACTTTLIGHYLWEIPGKGDMITGLYMHCWHEWFNSSSPQQNGRQFAEDIFKCISMNEKFGILIKISLKFVSNWQKDNIGSGDGLLTNRWQVITSTNVDSFPWCIYAALGGDELIRNSVLDAT